MKAQEQVGVKRKTRTRWVVWLLSPPDDILPLLQAGLPSVVVLLEIGEPCSPTMDLDVTIGACSIPISVKNRSLAISLVICR